jgi:hypothetical protein
MAILILATTTDEHAIAVADELEAVGRDTKLLDLSAFPQLISMSASFECCSDCGSQQLSLNLPNGDQLDLADIGAAWWRRPQQPALAPKLTLRSHREFALNECTEALWGLWHTMNCQWLNDPINDQVGHRKLYQLRIAQDVGLEIPPTLVTNDPHKARTFLDSHGYRDVVFKAFTGTEDEWRETRIVGPTELDFLDNVRFAPVIFQHYIDAVYDLRITIVDDTIFAAAVHSQETSYTVDFRIDIANARIEPVELPVEVIQSLRSLMARLDLRYGAVDMRLTPDGRYVFLEINPAGQWLFVEQSTGQPISKAVADALARSDHEHQAERPVTHRLRSTAATRNS